MHVAKSVAPAGQPASAGRPIPYRDVQHKGQRVRIRDVVRQPETESPHRRDDAFDRGDGVDRVVLDRQTEPAAALWVRSLVVFGPSREGQVNRLAQAGNARGRGKRCVGVRAERVLVPLDGSGGGREVGDGRAVPDLAVGILPVPGDFGADELHLEQLLVVGWVGAGDADLTTTAGRGGELGDGGEHALGEQFVALTA